MQSAQFSKWTVVDTIILWHTCSNIIFRLHVRVGPSQTVIGLFWQEQQVKIELPEETASLTILTHDIIKGDKAMKK